MRRLVLFIITTLVASGLIACQREKPQEYPLQGQVISLGTGHTEATIKHDDIKGFMPAMTMPYKVESPEQLDGIAPGDLIAAKLVVISNDAFLRGIYKTGTAPLEAPTVDVQKQMVTGPTLLKEGEPVPKADFVDQDGRKRSFADFNGSAVVLTFIYTKCPMPTFCPLMDRNFVALQEKAKADPALKVHLVTVSFDPKVDTPAVLKKHGQTLGADPKVWTFLTSDLATIDKFAGRFGVSVMRSMTDTRDITHNLRTAIIDRMGNVVKIYTGNEWTPDQVMANIKVLVGVD